jgi:hypothetical protein
MESGSIDKVARQLEQYRGQHTAREEKHGVLPVTEPHRADMGEKENNQFDREPSEKNKSLKAIGEQSSDLEPHLGKNIDVLV